MVDHDPHAGVSELLAGEQLDLRKRAGEALLDVGV